MGSRISSHSDLMSSSLPCVHNTPFSFGAAISFLFTVYTLIVCGPHLNNHSSYSLNSSCEMTSLVFAFNLVLLANRKTQAKFFLALGERGTDFIKCSKIGLSFDSVDIAEQSSYSWVFAALNLLRTFFFWVF